MANGRITRDEVIDPAVFTAVKQLTDDVNGLANAIINLSENVSKNNTQFTNTKTAADQLSKSEKDQQDNYKKSTELVTELTDKQKQLIDAQLKLNQQKKDYREVAQAEAILNDQSAGKIEKMTAQIKLLYIERRKMTEDGNFGKNLEEINKKINVQEKALRGLDTAEQARVHTVGKYKEAIEQFLPSLEESTEMSGTFLAKLAGFIPGFGLIGGAIALAATPLMAFFKDSEEGAERLETNIAGIKGAFNVLKGELISMGKSMAGEDGGEKSGFAKFIEAIASLPIVLTEKVLPNTKKVFDRMAEAGTTAQKITRENIELEKDAIKLIVERARAESMIVMARAKVAEGETSPQDRLRLLTQAIKAEEEITAKEIEHQKKVVEQIKLHNEELKKVGQYNEKINGKEEAEAEARLFQLRQDAYSKEMRALKQIQTAKKEIAEADKLNEKFRAGLNDIDTKSQIDAHYRDVALQNQNIFEDAIKLIGDQTDKTKTGIDDITNKIESDFSDAEKKKQDDQRQTLQLAQQIGDEIQNAFDQNYQDRIDKIKAESDAKILAANGDKAKINQIKKDEARQVAEVQRKQFLFDQAASVARIGISTAESIMKVAPNPVLIALVAALGAVQLATVLLKKPPAIPSFFKGTHDAPGGISWVGEQGRERIDLPGGLSYFTPSTATLVDLPAHAKVMPSDVVKSQFADMARMSGDAFISGRDLNHSEQMQLLREIRDRAIIIPMGKKVRIVEGNKTTILNVE